MKCHQLLYNGIQMIWIAIDAKLSEGAGCIGAVDGCANHRDPRFGQEAVNRVSACEYEL